MTKVRLIIAGVAVLAVVGTLLYLVLSQRQEMSEMTEVFTEEREQLVGEYDDLYNSYGDLHTENDSLSGLLVEQRARVEQLTEELKTLRASNARRIKELQAELGTLRTVMRSFVSQIDSLNQRNAALTEENTHIKGQLQSVSREKASLEEEKATLTGQMRVAARLEARAVATTTLNPKDKETSRLAQVAKIKVSFTLAKNVSAEVGMRSVFLRIVRPDGQPLVGDRGATFPYEDRQMNYSAKRDVEYGGEDTPSYIVYKVDMGELLPGRYETELFCGGERIGSGSFSLK